MTTVEKAIEDMADALSLVQCHEGRDSETFRKLLPLNRRMLRGLYQSAQRQAAHVDRVRALVSDVQEIEKNNAAIEAGLHAEEERVQSVSVLVRAMRGWRLQVFAEDGSETVGSEIALYDYVLAFLDEKQGRARLMPPADRVKT